MSCGDGDALCHSDQETVLHSDHEADVVWASDGSEAEQEEQEPVITSELVGKVGVDELRGLSYLGIVRLSGMTRNSRGSEYLLFGSRHLGWGNEETRIWCSASPKNFGRQEPRAVLSADSGAHNLCLIDDDGTHDRLIVVLGHVYSCTAFGVGGKFSTAARLRHRAGHDGVFLYRLVRNEGEFQVSRCRPLVDGHHKGVIERRVKCEGVGEFDGQSASVYFSEAFWLFTRANACATGGYRCVQVVRSADLCGDSSGFGELSLVHFPLVPADANIYYAHPLVAGDKLLLLMPICFEPPNEAASGIFVAAAGLTTDTLSFSAPWRIYHCDEVSAGRTADLNVASGVVAADGRLLLMVHRWIRSRMMQEDAEKKPPEELEWWQFNIARESATAWVLDSSDRGYLSVLLKSGTVRRGTNAGGYILVDADAGALAPDARVDGSGHDGSGAAALARGAAADSAGDGLLELEQLDVAKDRQRRAQKLQELGLPDSTVWSDTDVKNLIMDQWQKDLEQEKKTVDLSFLFHLLGLIPVRLRYTPNFS